MLLVTLRGLGPLEIQQFHSSERDFHPFSFSVAFCFPKSACFLFCSHEVDDNKLRSHKKPLITRVYTIRRADLERRESTTFNMVMFSCPLLRKLQDKKYTSVQKCIFQKDAFLLRHPYFELDSDPIFVWKTGQIKLSLKEKSRKGRQCKAESS